MVLLSQTMSLLPDKDDGLYYITMFMDLVYFHRGINKPNKYRSYIVKYQINKFLMNLKLYS